MGGFAGDGVRDGRPVPYRGGEGFGGRQVAAPTGRLLTIITTGRAGGMHLPPWGMPLAEPIGSANDLSLACPALPPQMRLFAHQKPPLTRGLDFA